MTSLEKLNQLNDNELSNVLGGKKSSNYSAGQAYGFMAGALIRGALFFY
ncbi:bacteriocin [uncultured Leuconostoc sp.]|nr:bacteriocin [uncultured Leuconostoc sp.]